MFDPEAQSQPVDFPADDGFTAQRRDFVLSFFDELFAEANRHQRIAAANESLIASLEQNLRRMFRMIDSAMYAISRYKPLVPSPLREHISADLHSKYENPSFDYRAALGLEEIPLP